MTGSPLVAEAADSRLEELLRNVDAMRPFVRYRLRGRPDDVDPVLQSVRETVWRRGDDYDERKGSPNAFVFGITRNVVRRELSRRAEATDELPIDLPSASTPDPLVALVDRYDSQRWMSLVADYVGEADWALIAELALRDGDADAVAADHCLTARALRTVRDRVSLTAHTVRAALAAADAGRPPSGPVLVRCLPDRGGIREAARMIGKDAEFIAEALHLHPGSARARIATAKRLLAIARDVLRQEAEP